MEAKAARSCALESEGICGKEGDTIPCRKRRDLSISHFDAEYYRRYYEDPATAVVSRTMQRNEVAFVLGFARHIGLEIRRFADVGAGTGWWAKDFIRQYPACPTIETFGASRCACEFYGH